MREIKRKSDKWFWLRLTVSLFAMTWLVFYSGIEETITIITNCQLAYLAVFMIGLITVIYFSAFEIWVSLKILGVNLSHRKVIIAGINSWVIGALTPARTGEISLAFFLSGSVSKSRILGILMLSKVCSLLVLCLLALISLWFLKMDINPIVYDGILFLVIGLILFAILTMRSNIQKFFNIFTKGKFKQYVTNHVGIFEKIFTKPKLYAWIFLSICFRWSIVFAITYVILKGINQNPSVGTVIAATAIGRLMALLPISIGGLGIKEPIQFFIYSTNGIPPEAVMGISILGMSCTYIAAVLIPIIAPVKKNLESKI